jgi:ADP-ribose pyrophosphatase YjhB (NUDIX family)
MKKTKRGGVIPYRKFNNEIKMLFMKPSNSKYGGEKYQIAKGHIDDSDVSIKHGAFREAKEELGLRKENVKNILFIGEFLNNINIYICEVINLDDFLEYTDETDSIKWMTYKEFMNNGRTIHKEIIKTVYDKLSN